MGFFERRRQEKEFGRNIERQLLDRLALTRELESRGFLTRVDNTWLLVDTGWKVSSSDGMAPASEALVAFTRITNFMTPMVRAIRTASDSSPASPWLTSPASVGLPPTRALGAVKSVEQGREPPLEARLAETQDKSHYAWSNRLPFRGGVVYGLCTRHRGRMMLVGGSAACWFGGERFNMLDMLAAEKPRDAYKPV
jgi:hypothetical protein